jgi:hypothetical protein
MLDKLENPCPESPTNSPSRTVSRFFKMSPTKSINSKQDAMKNILKDLNILGLDQEKGTISKKGSMVGITITNSTELNKLEEKKKKRPKSQAKPKNKTKKSTKGKKAQGTNEKAKGNGELEQKDEKSENANTNDQATKKPRRYELKRPNI